MKKVQIIKRLPDIPAMDKLPTELVDTARSEFVKVQYGANVQDALNVVQGGVWGVYYATRNSKRDLTVNELFTLLNWFRDWFIMRGV